MKRVVVTGMGMLTPLGCGVEPTWARLLKGESGAAKVERFEVSDIACKVAGNTTNGQVQIQDGQTRFVEVSMNGWGWTPTCEVAEVSPDRGQTAVRTSRRVEPL